MILQQIFVFGLVLYVINVLANAVRQRAYKTKALRRGKHVKIPPVFNDHSIWQLSVPLFGDIVTLVKMVHAGGILAYYQQQQAAMQPEPLHAFSLYAFGRYFTFVSDKDMQLRAYRSKDDELDFMRGTAFPLVLAMPRTMGEMMLNNRPATPAIMRYIAPKIMSHTLAVLENAIENELSARGWTKTEGITVPDWFDAMYDIAVRCNIVAFLKNMPDSKNKDFQNFVTRAFRASDPEKALVERNALEIIGKYLLGKFESRSVDVEYHKIEKALAPEVRRRLDELVEARKAGNFASAEQRLPAEEIDSLQLSLEFIIERDGFDLTSGPISADQFDKILVETAGGFFSFMFGAQANTYATLAWTTLHLLSENSDEETKKRFFAELEAAPQPISYEYVSEHMQFADLCINEAIRYSFPHIGRMRQVMNSQGYLLDGKDGELLVPEGSIISLLTQGFNEDVVGLEPKKYDPLRLEKYKDTIGKNKIHLTPWGLDKHICKGMKYAQMFIKTFLVVLFRRCEVRLVSSQAELAPTKEMMAGASQPSGPIRVLLKAKN